MSPAGGSGSDSGLSSDEADSLEYCESEESTSLSTVRGKNLGPLAVFFVGGCCRFVSCCVRLLRLAAGFVSCDRLVAAERGEGVTAALCSALDGLTADAVVRLEARLESSV